MIQLNPKSVKAKREQDPKKESGLLLTKSGSYSDECFSVVCGQTIELRLSGCPTFESFNPSIFECSCSSCSVQYEHTIDHSYVLFYASFLSSCS